MEPKIIWEITFGTNSFGDNVETIYGLAVSGQDAAKKALNTQVAKEYEGIYISRLKQIGNPKF